MLPGDRTFPAFVAFTWLSKVFSVQNKNTSTGQRCVCIPLRKNCLKNTNKIFPSKHLGLQASRHAKKNYHKLLN
jgi:hypothetical protein